MWLVLATLLLVPAVWLCVRVVRNHGPSAFYARVSGSLFDLGIDVGKLDSRLTASLRNESIAYHAALGKKASPHELSVRFLIRLTEQHLEALDSARRSESVLVQAI